LREDVYEALLKKKNDVDEDKRPNLTKLRETLLAHTFISKSIRQQVVKQCFYQKNVIDFDSIVRFNMPL